MFYTKYRPQKFEDLVGVGVVQAGLKQSLAKRRVGHAYLFCGPRGTGKTTTARILAKALNCEQVDSKDWVGEPCGECASCRAISEGRFLDLIEIDGASNRGIDDIRSLREKIKLSPTLGRKKVYVIDEAHMLTREAFNALLKTLEEPPSHAVFVLCTTEPKKIPETVRSRCQIFEFRRARECDIKEKLRRVCVAEGVEVSDEDLVEIARAARGGFRDAETILEQVIVGGEPVGSLIGALRGEKLVNFIDFLVAKDAKAALTFLDRFYELGGDMGNFNRTLLEYLRDLLLLGAGVSNDEMVETEEVYQKMKDQSGVLFGDRLCCMIDEFTQSFRMFSVSPLPTLPLELAVVKVCGKSGHSQEKVCDDVEDSVLPTTNELGGLQTIKEHWTAILRAIRPYNHSLEALLRSVQPKSFDGELLTLEAFYAFHKDRLSTVKNCSIVENAVGQVLKIPVKVHCVLGRKGAVDVKKEVKKEPVADLEGEAVGVFGEDLG